MKSIVDILKITQGIENPNYKSKIKEQQVEEFNYFANSYQTSSLPATLEDPEAQEISGFLEVS